MAVKHNVRVTDCEPTKILKLYKIEHSIMVLLGSRWSYLGCTLESLLTN